MNFQEVTENARGNIGPYCKACNVCNGLACKNTIPGPGAKGNGTVAARNYAKWQEICINMDTICQQKPVNTELELFGKTFRYPVFAGPVGAVKLHYGEKYTDLEYNEILVEACAKHGVAAFTGDGTNPQVMTEAAALLNMHSPSLLTATEHTLVLVSIFKMHDIAMCISVNKVQKYSFFLRIVYFCINLTTIRGMIQSMTGYGKSVVTYGDKKINVEVKSLNSKALDLSARIAPLYRERFFRDA